MLGQMMVTAFPGPQPSTSLLARIQDGELGGVILFSDNVVGGPLATRALTRELQSAAARGGNPPLLIMTDQEGGAANRLVGPPAVPPARMTSAAQALDQGVETGRLLREEGINVDLAPVRSFVDVPLVLEIGGLPHSGGPGLDTDEALRESFDRLTGAAQE